MRLSIKKLLVTLFMLGSSATFTVRAEIMLQFFNMSWQELIDKMPEIAETGYTSLWLPPPQKASGDLSVGYDLWDPFDIGGNPQRTGGRTRYGTEEEMLRMIDTAHRHGLRVYFDNIMNHRAFDIPGYNENTPIDLYPGMLPEDFHLRVTEEGFYRPWGNTVNWGSTWEVQNQYLSGLIDIAHETPNSNFGPTLGSTHPKISFVRHPNNPEYYDYHPTEGHVGFGSPLITTNVIADNPGFYKEDVGSYMMRSIRWLVDYTKLDGLRLDAVKHVPAYFFGKQSGDDKDGSNDGYIGQAQWQFNHTRGFSDWNNHRDSNFNSLQPRDDLLVFGEHMGEPPGYGEYFASGMRLLDAKTHSTLNNLGFIDLGILQTSDYIPDMQFGKNLGIYYAKSHDDNIAFGEHLHYALNLTREGIGNIYTDGNRQAPTLGDSGGAFPRHANTRPFGQFGDTRVPNLVHIHNSFARGGQYGAWADNDVVSYTRRDFSENNAMTDGDATTMHFMLNRNWDSGAYREIPTTFPEGSILWQYADGGGKFYHQVTDNKIKVTIPPAGYFAFSWRSPEESRLWQWGGGKPITLLADGQPASTITYERWDGPDGDREFNPYGLPNRGYPEGVAPKPFTYLHTIPRVTSATNLAFYAHVDGSANNVMFKLNGGIPLNNLNHEGGDPRDFPPAVSQDMYLGYEQADFHARIWPEKFGSRNADLNQIGSASAETFEFVVGESGFTFWTPENAANDYSDATGPVFVYHNPEINTDDGRPQVSPAPVSAANQPISFEVKTGNQGDTDRVFVYYTTDGSWPNGAGGFGIGNTRVVELFFRTNVTEGGGGGEPGPTRDDASNYSGGWSTGSNGGNGFTAWNLYSGGASSGNFIWDSTEYGHANINSSGKAFGMYGYSNQYANAERGINAWTNGSSFSIDLATQWRDGNRGISFFNSSTSFASSNEIWNLNISNDGYGNTGFDYHADMKLNITATQSGANLQVTVNGSSFTESWSGTWTTNISSQTLRGFRLYTGGDHASDGQRNLYFNNLVLTSPAAPPALASTPGVGVLAGEVNDWWAFGTIPAQPAGTRIKYKISGLRQQGFNGRDDWEVLFPNSWDALDRKLSRMGTWKIENFNPSAAVYRPHNDYGLYRTGLVEGFNFIAARAFLQRDGAAEGNGQRASIYNTFYQPFYYDATPPAGEVKFPAQNDTLNDNRFGIVVRTDPTVTRVWYNIVDSDPSNDDSVTAANQGNGNNTNSVTSWIEAQRVNPSIFIDSDYPLEWRFNYVNIPASGTATIRVKLAEYSSSTNPLVSDAAGRFTTLERTVNTRGPAYRMNVAWPQNDGDNVGEGYEMKVHFSANLAVFDENITRSRFLITLNGAPQDRSSMRFNYFINDDTHELAFTLPDLYNGDPNYEHTILVTHTNAAGTGVSLSAQRRVRVPTGAPPPPVQIINPPEFNLDGAPYQIVLPDIANPDPETRRHDITVQTTTNAKSVWITFTNSTGFASPVASSVNALSGTVSVTANSTVVTGDAHTLFQSQISAGSVIQISGARYVVSIVPSNDYLKLTAPYTGVTASGLTAQRITGNPAIVGENLLWQFNWSNLTAGAYTIVANMDTDNNTATIEASARRTMRVILRQMVEWDDSGDSDNDGLADTNETARISLPDTNPETWKNSDVHIWNIYGRTDPLRPDTDGDNLPDGLELGWGGATGGTDPAVDTNGDGWPNFIGDSDPPIYNTTDNSQHPRYNFNASRTDQLSGSITDPNRADTDGDGLNDDIEDRNRNGRVDVGLVNGSGVVTNVLRGWYETRSSMYLPMVYNTSRVDRDALPVNARFLETDPNNADTIGDGMSDGAADVNANGRVDMALLYQDGTMAPFDITAPANRKYLLGMDDASQTALATAGLTNIISRAINYEKLFTDFGRPVIGGDGNWYETNKWPRILILETDPLNRDTDGDGLLDGWEMRYGIDPLDDGWYNLRTGVMSLTNTQQGGDGDLTGDGITNEDHQLAGSDPRIDVNIPVPVGSINIGPGPVIGQLNGVDIREEFMDWTWNDLRALDFYHGDGPNSKQGDVFRGWDGYDESRDLVAFYTRDGGAIPAGDNKFYFRVDFYDLQPFAENEFMDLYVVIDTGNQSIGERVLPDQVDTLTDMRWELVVAVYNAASGRVYVDTNPGQNTSTFSDDLFTFGGVTGRADYFLGAYFNAGLDAVEFAIDRQALIDAGYIGDPAALNFQVFTVKPGTQNSPQGPGDIGGRSDIRDSILNDYIAEDDFYAQDGLRGAGSVLRQWIRGNARPNRAKFSKIVHGNQAIQPGDVIQNLINNNAGAGYYRPVDAHDALGVPFNLHVTPTLASAIQWASSDTKAWRDGPAFNARIGELARTNKIALMASTFSDHMMPYFTPDFVADNIALADDVLETIYGVNLTANSVFWTPERLLDADVFAKITAAGYRATVLDQMEHLQQWYGRNAALGNRGYQINRIDGVDTFAINNGANDFRFANHDGGLNMPLRRLFNRKARGDWDQVIILMSDWGDFTSKTVADAYDRNLVWMANRPWIHGVTLESILMNEVDLDGDGNGNAWYVEERSSPGNNKRAHNYVNYMTRFNYDNWYLGSGLEEGLSGKQFNIRPGVPVPNEYGMLYTGGVVSQAWNAVRNVNNGGLDKLARGALHASVFQTAFHSGDLGDMTKFSDGTYITPDGANKTLAGFASVAQAHTRHAAIYARVNQWLASAASLTNARTEQVDVDLDGEVEYLLYNKRVFGVFERSGGRMIAAWARDAGTGAAYQMIGNLLSWAGSETEEEGASNETAYRTSALKDWFASSASRGYVNDLYDFTSVSGGWRIAKGTDITKTITLGDDNAWFTANYQVAGGLGTLFVRNGLSPDLYGLLVHGQQYLSAEQNSGGIVSLAQAYADRTIAAKVAYGSAAGHSASFNGAAVDGAGLDTRRMRKQAQTHQVEISGSGTFSFAIGFEISSEGEQFNNGVPYSWLSGNGYDPETVDVNSEMAANGVNTLYQAYVADLDPRDANALFQMHNMVTQAGAIVIRFNTSSEREYMIWYNDNGLVNPTWFQGPTNMIQGTGNIYEWEDDGTETDPAPTEVDHRFYKIEVSVPE